MKNRYFELLTSTALTLGTFAGLCPRCETAEATKLPTITMRDALSSGSPTVNHLSWLGDSRLVAVWREPDRKSAVIVSWDLSSGTRRTLGNGDYPSASPDGRWIAYLDDKQWKLISSAGGNALPIGTAAPQKPIVEAPPHWSRDGRYVAILYMLRPPPTPLFLGNPEEQDGVRVIDVGRAAVVAASEGQLHQQAFVTVLDVHTPNEPKTIALDESYAYHGDWGPEHAFYFVGMQGYWTGTQAYTALKRLEVRGMSIAEVYRSTGFMQSAAPKVSPDGEKIGIALDVDGKSWDDYNSLILIDARTGHLERLTTDQDVIGASYNWTADGKVLYFGSRYGGLDQVYRADLQHRVTRISHEERSYSDIHVSPNGRWLVYQTEDGYGHKDLRIRPTETTAEEQVIAVITDPAKEFRLGTFRHIRWTSSGNLEIWGYLFMPPDFNPAQKYPLYVNVHGGGPGEGLSLDAPLGTALTTSPLEWHAWAAEGYVVLVPDMRSSGEYGADVAASRYATKDWDAGGIQKDVVDIETGTLFVIAQGYIDPKRVAVFGHSAGGARVNFLLTHSTLYRAGIIHEAIAAGALPTTIWLTTGEHTGVGFDEDVISRGVTLEHDPSVYTGGFLFDGYRSRTPTLILVGNPKKGATPPLSSEVLFSVLRQYRVPSRMLRYVDDGHNPLTVASALHCYNEIHNWLATYMPASSDGSRSPPK